MELGLEFIEEEAKFPSGKILKANVARALRRASLDEAQKQRIRQRVFGLLRDGHVPHEFREYAKLVRRIGFDAEMLRAISSSNELVKRCLAYFENCGGV